MSTQHPGMKRTTDRETELGENGIGLIRLEQQERICWNCVTVDDVVAAQEARLGVVCCGVAYPRGDRDIEMDCTTCGEKISFPERVTVVQASHEAAHQACSRCGTVLVDAAPSDDDDDRMVEGLMYGDLDGADESELQEH